MVAGKVSWNTVRTLSLPGAPHAESRGSWSCSLAGCSCWSGDFPLCPLISAVLHRRPHGAPIPDEWWSPTLVPPAVVQLRGKGFRASMPTDVPWGAPDLPGVTQCHPNTIPLLGLRQRRPTISWSHRQGSTQCPQPWGFKGAQGCSRFGNTGQEGWARLLPTHS